MTTSNRNGGLSGTIAPDKHIQPAGGQLLHTVQDELATLRDLVTKRTNRILLESAIESHDFDEVKSLLVQLLCNISDDAAPLYDRYTDTISQKAMRLFYNMPATVLTNFRLPGSALEGLQVAPQADESMTKSEYLVWQMATDNATVADDVVGDYNDRLAQNGYEPLDEEQRADRAALALLYRAQRDRQARVVSSVRKAMCCVLREENELAPDFIGER